MVPQLKSGFDKELVTYLVLDMTNEKGGGLSLSQFHTECLKGLAEIRRGRRKDARPNTGWTENSARFSSFAAVPSPMLWCDS